MNANFWAHLSLLVRTTMIGAIWAGTPMHATAQEIQLPRRGINLLENSHLAGITAWETTAGGSYDPTLSFANDGSGSYRLFLPYPATGYGQLISRLVPMMNSKPYLFALRMRSLNGPSYVTIGVAEYNANKTYLRQKLGLRWGSSQDLIWEEAVYEYQPSVDAAYVKVSIGKMENAQGDASVWIDDLFFAQSPLGFMSPPAAKKKFDGNATRVDELGNISIFRNGDWVPFFPICVYADSERSMTVYSDQGWNCSMATNTASGIAAAKAAVSAFNPYGMMSALEIDQYATRSLQDYGNIALLKSRIDQVLQANLGDNFLFYYWDNEENWAEWDMPKQVAAAVFEKDRGRNGIRGRPIYMLQGNYGLARTFSKAGLMDLVGTYFLGDEGTGGVGGGKDGVIVLNHVEGQESPFSIAQFNDVNGGGEMRARIYRSIILGAKGFGFWRDCYSSSCLATSANKLVPIDQKLWWGDMPNLRREIDQLLPLIRQPHWTAWRAEILNSASVYIGTRDLDNIGYLVLANAAQDAKNVQVTVSGLNYTAVTAQDYFTGRAVATIENGTFSLELPGSAIGQGTKVLRLLDSLGGTVSSPLPPADVRVE